MLYRKLTTEKEVIDLLVYHSLNSEFIVLDCETTHIDPRTADLIDVQITGTADYEVAIFSKELAFLLPMLEGRVSIIGHNYKYDRKVLERAGVNLSGWFWKDTILLGHLADENRDSYSLDSYVKDLWQDNYKDEFWAKYDSYLEAPEDERYTYAAKDVAYTRKLALILGKSLKEQGVPHQLIEDVHKLQECLLQTEQEGIAVDVGYISELGVKLKNRLEELYPLMCNSVTKEMELIEYEMWIKEMDKRKTPKGRKGVPMPKFSFESANQLKDLLYTKIRLPPQKNEKTRQVSTDYASLEKIKDLHPVVGLIQENRELQKVYGTYIEGTIERLENERIYPEFRINGTKGSRISHSNPNLGQLPAGGGIRGIYIPDSGYAFSEFDYSQLEVCIEAHYTKDPNLLEIVTNNASKHDITAHNLKIDRVLAKTLNFAMQYWCSHFKIAKILQCSEREALLIYNKYWETYKGVKQLKSGTDKMIDSGEPIRDLFGRLRRFEVRKRNPWDRDYRSGYNFLIQSTGGQIMNNAFWKADALLRESDIGKGVLTVHDSGLFSIRKESDYINLAIENLMVEEGQVSNLSVPLKVTSSVGMARWED